MTRFLHSIRWRVQAWQALILCGVILAFCFTTYQLAWDHQMRRVSRELVQRERTLIRVLMDAVPPATPDGPREPFSPARLLALLRSAPPVLPAEVATLFASTEPGFSYFTLRDPAGTILLQSPNFPADVEALRPPPATDFHEEWRMRQDRRELLRSNPEGLRSLFGVDLSPERDELRRFAWSLGAAGLGVWLLGLAGGWWLAGRAIRPIETISQTATRIAAGNLTERISTAGTDSELDQLSRVLNATFDRLAAAVERQKQFTADASHELRTPVTLLLAETQRVLKRDRAPEDYRAALETCQASAGRMRRLIEALLLLARQEAASADVAHEPCDLAVLARDTLAHLQPLATERQLTLTSDLAPAPCHGDPAALAILASNLVANALHHHDRADGSGGTVQVTTAIHEGRAILTVSDDGPGIPAADLPHVFQRFYRADKVRTGGTPHTGLGLAIAQTIATNHGGTITAENNATRGACFTVTLPVDRISE